MSPPLDDQYLTWLYSQVGSVRLRNSSRTHWSLLRQLYTKEFIWIIPNDDNRVEDGRDLRFEFLESEGLNQDQEWLSLGCSMLEMMIALSRRLAFETGDKPRDWFWHLIETLDLEQFNDRTYDDHARTLIDETLDRVIWRLYSADGRGGLFPLRHATEDQTQVEIWYQLSAYLAELM